MMPVMLRAQEQPLRCQSCRLGIASGPKLCPFRDLRRPAGTVLVQEGERPEAVWYLRRGQVAVGPASASGADASSAVRGPDSILGIEALVGTRAGYEARALTDIVVCVLEAEDFRAWVGSLEGPVGALVSLLVNENARRISEREALEGTAVQRVARHLANRFGNVRDMDAPDLSQRVLASTLDMRPETLSRALGTLRREGALAGGRGIRLRDLGRLRGLAGQSDA